MYFGKSWDPKVQAAHSKLQRAVRLGHIVKPTKCEGCNNLRSNYIFLKG